MRNDVIQNYDLLKDKIIFTDTDKVLKFLSNNLVNLNSYFDNKEILLAKETFNNRLNVNSKRKIYDLSKCIKNAQKKNLKFILLIIFLYELNLFFNFL